MGREVRRVPADWQHPKDEHGYFIPLFDGKIYEGALRDWERESRKDFAGDWQPLDNIERAMAYAEWACNKPDADDYMPRWTETAATHLMMYEDTTEGTPISPAFATAEELAQWLVENGASAFGEMTADYDQWLYVAKGGWMPGLIITLSKHLD